MNFVKNAKFVYKGLLDQYSVFKYLKVFYTGPEQIIFVRKNVVTKLNLVLVK